MSTDATRNDAQAEYWEGRSASWIAAESWHELVTGPFGSMAIDRLDLRPGESLLDIGCGTGPSSFDAARRVGPSGSVVGVDIAAPMIETARERLGAADVSGATVAFRVADAQADDLGDGTFDAACSQFGVMFFSDPPAAFANIRRALRDGGRLAFACWQDVFSNEWMFVPGAAAAEVTGQLPTMPGPGEPGPFSLADPDRIRTLLEGAGFGGVAVEPVDHLVVADPEGIDEIAVATSQLGAAREAMAAADGPEMRDRIVESIGAALRTHVVDGELRLGANAWIVSATR